MNEMDSGSTPSFIFACRDEDKLMLCAQGCIEANVNKQSQGPLCSGTFQMFEIPFGSQSIETQN